MEPSSAKAERQISKEQISAAIRKERSQWHLAPQEINDGRCGVFADKVLQRLGGGGENLHKATCEIDGGWTLGRWGGHTWIHSEALQLHFDAEAPEGKADWQRLPLYERKKEDLSCPIGPIGTEILENPAPVVDPDVIRWIEGHAGNCHVYAHRPDGSSKRSGNPDAEHVPTRWHKGRLPVSALKGAMSGRCPGRKEWREWLKGENEARERRGFPSYDAWFEGGIREPIFVDGQEGEHDGKFAPMIWDGWHRTAWSIVQGKETIPAYLGTEPGPAPATKVACEAKTQA